MTAPTLLTTPPPSTAGVTLTLGHPALRPPLPRGGSTALAESSFSCRVHASADVPGDNPGMPDDAHLIAGRYRLESVLGQGGMGRVWQGHDESLGRPVAIKEITLPAGVPQAERELLCERMMREARVTARLSHPAIIAVYDVVSFDGRPFIVMELVHGPSLADEIDRHGRLAPQRVARIGLYVLAGLGAAHGAGIVHRDVKPSNVLLAADGRIVLTDFGIAVSEGDATLTSTGLLIGSPAYMSPERLRSEPTGPATDLWALGATLYAAVEGVPPFGGGSTVGAITAVLTAEVVPPRVDGPLREAVLGMLVKSAEQRLPEDRVRALLQEAVEGVPRRTPSQRVLRDSATRSLPVAPVAAGGTAAAATTRPPASSWPPGMSDRAPGRAGRPPAVPGRPPRRPVRSALIAALAALLLVPLGVLAVGQLGGQLDLSQDAAPAPPDPFESQELFDFSRGLFDPNECARPAPGELPILEENPDEEALLCQGSTYEARLFRQASVDGLQAERALYASKAEGDTREAVAGAPADEGLDGTAFTFTPQDGLARLYWDSVSCLCAGVIAAPGADAQARVDLVEFWREG